MLKVGSAGAAWIAAAAILVAPRPAVAQPTGETAPARPAAAQADAGDEPDLPVSLDRIRAKLAAEPRPTENPDGLRLSYYVDVYGVAPRLDLFSPEINLTTAPVQYGGMTHREFLDLVTPQEFRSPAADIPSAIAALVKWLESRRGTPDKR
jgi:hypothetical protein